MEGTTAKQVARWVALGALFLLPLTPLLVVNGYFFPFITGKAFYFRILVEIAVAAWVVLALVDRAYRPRFSWIGAAVVSLLVWMFIADAFAPNAAKAFWSNFERMEGWVLLAHLFGFFVAAGAVLRVEKKWRAWFLASLLVSLLVSAYALLQLAGSLPIHQGSVRIDASLGNSAYLAVYFLFNVFIALWLALTERHAWLTWSLVALAILESALLFLTETRGAIIGLVFALFLAAGLTAFTAGRRARRLAAGALVLILVLVGGFYLARTSSFVQNNHVLERIASISPADGATRFTIWRMALKGVLERPLTGWGQEGFNYVFNAHYDPSLHGQEPWFDRAHNAFVDWLTAGGLPAFLLYLSLFGSALWLLWKSSALSRPERIALTAALAGYAIHNFFVFDNLSSYLYFFAILALVDSQVARPIERLERLPELAPAESLAYALPVCTAAALVLVWFVNIPGMRTTVGLITAMKPSAVGIDGNIAAFENVAAHPSFAAQEVREQLVSFAASVAQSSQATNAQKERAVSLAIREMQKQVTTYPRDARGFLELSYAYRAAGDSTNELKAIEAALALSPRKESFWVEAGMAEWNAGDVAAARKDFHTAYALGPSFLDLAAYAAAGDIIAGDQAAADTLLRSAFGTTAVDSDVLAFAYYRAKEWSRLIDLWEARAAKPDAPVETWFSLAAAQYTAGQHAAAVQTINEAVARFPSAASSGAAAITQIENSAAGQ